MVFVFAPPWPETHSQVAQADLCILCTHGGSTRAKKKTGAWRCDSQEVGDVRTMAHMPEEAKDQLWWVRTKDTVCDQLTKSMSWDDVRETPDSTRPSCGSLTVDQAQAIGAL